MKKGFTLAEVLITLGIIGVVAALTLPNMIKNHQKRVMVAQLQRTYNAIVNAMPSYMDEVHATKLFDTDAFNANRNNNDVTPLVNFIKDNFKISKICTKDTTGGLAACYGNGYKDLSGETPHNPHDNSLYNGFDSAAACTILKTGATVCFGQMWDQWTFPRVLIDVNGAQGPNVWGRDAYDLELNNAGDLAESFDTNIDLYPDHTHKTVNCGGTQGPGNSAYSDGCFNKIIEDGWKMDY